MKNNITLKRFILKASNCNNWMPYFVDKTSR
jgi:hypothetical protein